MNDSMNTFGKRLHAARKMRGIALDDLFELHPSWSRHTYKAHEAGQRVPKMDTVVEYANTFNVRPEWLLMGVGNITDPPLKNLQKAQQKVIKDINDSLDSLLKHYERSTPEVQKRFKVIIENEDKN